LDIGVLGYIGIF